MGLWGPEAAVTEEEDEDEEEEAGARRSGPGLAGQRLRGKGRRGRVASPAGRPDTLSRRGAGETLFWCKEGKLENTLYLKFSWFPLTLWKAPPPTPS